jgi:hypothetical protein
MAVPSQGTVAVGDKITASLWNDDVRDAVDFLISPPRVKVYKTASQSIGDASWACLTWNAEAFDTDTMHSNVTANSRITFNTAGTYLITLNCFWANNATGLRNHTVEKNGTTTQGSGPEVIQPFAISPVAASYTGASISVVATFAANDYIQAFVWQNSGGALNLVGTTQSHSSLSANWIAS